MLHEEKYKITVTDRDIDQAVNGGNYNPLQLAIARATNKDPEEVDVRRTGVFISVYDYADFIKYDYDEECKDIILNELSEWEDYKYGVSSDTALYMESFTCNLTLNRAI